MIKRFLLFLFFSLFAVHAYSQAEENENKLFSESLAIHLPKYNKLANLAYRIKDYDEAERLFDSLVNHCLTDSYFDNFKFKKVNNKEVSIDEFKKPIYLITFVSWCISGKGEIPALNEIAKRYQDDVDFVVLFWDKRKKVKELSKDFNKHINLVYVNEMENNGAFVVRQLKHSLGLPVSFFIDKNRKLLSINRSVSHSLDENFEESFTLAYEHFESHLSTHIKNKPDILLSNVLWE